MPRTEKLELRASIRLDGMEIQGLKFREAVLSMLLHYHGHLGSDIDLVFYRVPCLSRVLAVNSPATLE